MTTLGRSGLTQQESLPPVALDAAASNVTDVGGVVRRIPSKNNDEMVALAAAGMLSPRPDDSIKVRWQGTPGSPDSPTPLPGTAGPAPSSTGPGVASTSGSKLGQVPGFAMAMQSGLLKRINSFRSKEELLAFVAAYHMLLDPINLVTCLYRLAKMSFTQRNRGAYLAELQQSSTFQLLLRTISSKFLHAQLIFLHQGVDFKGVDARCLANLVWALVKLDLSNDSKALTTELALNVAPFVCRCLHTCSPQGLANMLWAYSKLPVSPPEVILVLMGKITEELRSSLRQDHAHLFDAQALSNSIWALAHLKGRGMDLETTMGNALLRFLEALAQAAGSMLASLNHHRADLRTSHACKTFLQNAESNFSCQALVNIAWSFATLINGVCATHTTIRQLFSLIHTESILRLQATAVLLQVGDSLPYQGAGGFNEQALCNAVFAFDKAGLLRRDLLQAIFAVTALRLHRSSVEDTMSFKPQELCTLLKVCHTNIAPPWQFLTALYRCLSLQPSLTASWSPSEQAELARAWELLRQHLQMQTQSQAQTPSSLPMSQPELSPARTAAIPTQMGSALSALQQLQRAAAGAAAGLGVGAMGPLRQQEAPGGGASTSNAAATHQRAGSLGTAHGQWVMKQDDDTPQQQDQLPPMHWMLGLR